MVVREGSNVSLRCEATGSPTPNITWRREDGELIILGKSQGKNKQEGKLFASQRRERGLDDSRESGDLRPSHLRGFALRSQGNSR
jgi:hypothetical protein